MIPPWIQVAFAGADPELCYKSLREFMERGEPPRDPPRRDQGTRPLVRVCVSRQPRLPFATQSVREDGIFATQSVGEDGMSWVRLATAASFSPPPAPRNEGIRSVSPAPPSMVVEEASGVMVDRFPPALFQETVVPSALFKAPTSFPGPVIPSGVSPHSASFPNGEVPNADEWDHISEKEADEVRQSSSGGSVNTLGSAGILRSKPGSAQVLGGEREQPLPPRSHSVTF